MALTEYHFYELVINEIGTYGFYYPKNMPGFFKGKQILW